MKKKSESKARYVVIPKEQPAKDIHIRISSNSVPHSQGRHNGRENIRYSETDRRIASHPSAWAHGYMIQDERQPHIRRFVSTSSGQPRARSPSDWYYRRYSTRPISRAEAYARRPTDPREFYARTSAQRLSRERTYSRSPRRRVVNPPHPPHRDLWAEHRRYHRFSQRGTASEEDHRRVRFAPGTNGRGALRRQSEAIRDHAQARRDQHDLNHVKRHVRHRIHEGGRAFEIDGHYSAEYEHNRKWSSVNSPVMPTN